MAFAAELFSERGLEAHLEFELGIENYQTVEVLELEAEGIGFKQEAGSHCGVEQKAR